MSKLTKAQAKAHEEACKLLTQDRLNEDERWFVLENWREDAKHINSSAGAFFTPVGLARDFTIEVGDCRTVIDLCAGIGALALHAWYRAQWDRGLERLVCVEINEDYAAVGRKILPEAEWIVGSVFDLPPDLGPFDCAISNPPFGKTARDGGSAPRYTGPAFEYHVIDIAADLARRGVFILPQQSAPFRYSGVQCFRQEESEAYKRFAEQTGLVLEPNCGIDTSIYRQEWRGTAPATEIVCCDFDEWRAARASKAVEPSPAPVAPPSDQPDLFGEAA